jgi:hypothetical protein
LTIGANAFALEDVDDSEKQNFYIEAEGLVLDIKPITASFIKYEKCQILISTTI